jgi:hypothetical protein
MTSIMCVCCNVRENPLDNKIIINVGWERFHYVVNDLAYWEWSVNPGLATRFQVLEMDWVCGIMLPLLANTKSFPPNTGDMRYALVDKEWKVVKEDRYICC